MEGFVKKQPSFLGGGLPAARNIDDLPDNISGRTREHILEVRRRYDFLFGLIQNSGLRISEALSVRVRDIRQVNGMARSVRVIGKGNKERIVPLPEAFGQVFGSGSPISPARTTPSPRGRAANPRAPGLRGPTSTA